MLTYNESALWVLDVAHLQPCNVLTWRRASALRFRHRQREHVVERHGQARSKGERPQNVRKSARRRTLCRVAPFWQGYNERVNKRLYRIPADERIQLFDRVSTLVRQPDVSFAYVLGSSLAEPAFHDIDVAVYLSDPAEDPRARAVELAEDLSRALESPVDVQPLNHAPISFVFHALRGRLLFCRDDERLATTIEDTVRRYLDMEPLIRHATREAFAS